MRYYTAPTTPEKNPYGSVPLSVTAKAAVYKRQSTQAQLKNNLQSKEMQSTELVKYLVDMGYPEENIALYDEGALSGSFSFDERPELNRLYQDISRGVVKTVIAFKEDRLFRDEDMIDPAVFMKMCKSQGCSVVIPYGMVYDFSNSYHAKQFRNSCEEAANFYNIYVRDRLQRGKMMNGVGGLYDGRGIATGYLVDRTQRREDGSLNPNYKKYIPYAPYVPIIRGLFQKYIACGCRLADLCKAVEQENDGYVFPPYEAWVDRETVSRSSLRHSLQGDGTRGYKLSRFGLVSILTNVAYIGWWTYKGQVAQIENHEPIVDREVFDTVFHSLSLQDAGDIKGGKKKSTYERKADSATHAAILKDVIVGHDHPAYVKVSAKGIHYAITDAHNHITGYEVLLSLPVEDVDAAFIDRLKRKITGTKDFDSWKRKEKDRKKELEQHLISIDASICEIESEMEHIVENMCRVSNQELIAKMEKRYGELKVRLATTKAKKEGPAQDTQLKAYNTFQQLAGGLLEHWDRLDTMDKRNLVRTLVKRVILTEMTPHWARIDIEWIDSEWGTESAWMYRQWGERTVWTDQDVEFIQAHYTGGKKTTILMNIPNRSWVAIANLACEKGWKRGVRGVRGQVQSEIPDCLCWADWAFMQEKGIVPMWEEAKLASPYSNCIFWW